MQYPSLTIIDYVVQPRLAAYILETPVILWHKGLTFERTMYTDAMAAATRQQSDAEITHVFKNQNQGMLWTW